MEQQKYIFIYLNQTNANSNHRTTLGTEMVNIYRGEFNEILSKTDDEVEERLSKVFKVAKREFSNTVVLENGDRIMWQPL